MAARQDYIEAYPLSAKAAVHTPVVFRAGMDYLGSLPWPSLEGLRDFASFARIGDSALRTALSRAKAEGSLVVEKDGAGTKRYRLSQAKLDIGLSLIHAEARPEGFILAVFSFRSEDSSERAALRDLLRDFGFRKLAQNTYINGRIETKGLKAEVKKLGLEDHLFVFTCPDIEDGDLVRRILSLFDLEARKAELSAYLKRLQAFLPEGLGDDDLARRLLYVGPVHYERCEVGEPPFPATYLPEDYPLREIQAFYGERLSQGQEKMLAYYTTTNQ